jgi:L-glyceraldehyde 3-phosphate reductase
MDGSDQRCFWAREVQSVVVRVLAFASARVPRTAQMAIAWTLRDARVTSALIGASSFEQLDHNVGALAGLDFSAEELAAIDRHAVESGVKPGAASISI